MTNKRISNALISVYNKDGLAPIVKWLQQHQVHIYSTGGTRQFIQDMGVEVFAVEELTDYPSILDGRVKTLHPKIFGGILARTNQPKHLAELNTHQIPTFDLVIVDLYPFEETLKSEANEQEIIEKIDIGGISLIRAAAKNFEDVAIIPSMNEYGFLTQLLKKGNSTQLEDRKYLAAQAFRVSASYDTAIAQYFSGNQLRTPLRYGENPHQKGFFVGNLNEVFEQLHGKELSYNNLLDVDATLNYLHGLKETTVAIIKHNNACGLAQSESLLNAWHKALASDPVSAFGGVIGINKPLDEKSAKEINKLFFEVIIAPDYEEAALALLKTKKNRVILKLKLHIPQKYEQRNILNGYLEQQKDMLSETAEDLTAVTDKKASAAQIKDLLLANHIAKNSKSNTIALVKDQQLLGLGCGMTSRVDALAHALTKAKSFGLNLEGSAMASDAFFPFPDCVEIAHLAGISTVIQPGGSIKDSESITYCNTNNMVMVTTGNRHFKH